VGKTTRERKTIASVEMVRFKQSPVFHPRRVGESGIETNLYDDESPESEARETGKVGEVAFENVEGPDGRLGSSRECVGFVHLGQERAEDEVEDSREEGERSRDQEEPASERYSQLLVGLLLR
jgi:hypothetical protein